jgi:hypothetical protein
MTLENDANTAFQYCAGLDMIAQPMSRHGDLK